MKMKVLATICIPIIVFFSSSELSPTYYVHVILKLENAVVFERSGTLSNAAPFYIKEFESGGICRISLNDGAKFKIDATIACVYVHGKDIYPFDGKIQTNSLSGAYFGENTYRLAIEIRSAVEP